MGQNIFQLCQAPNLQSSWKYDGSPIYCQVQWKYYSITRSTCCGSHYSYLLLAPQQKNQQQQAAIAEASRAAANAGRNQFSHLSLAAKSLKFITTPMWNYTYCISE